MRQVGFTNIGLHIEYNITFQYTKITLIKPQGHIHPFY